MQTGDCSEGLATASRSRRMMKPLVSLLAYSAGLFLFEAIFWWTATVPYTAWATPALSKVENRTKQYFYSSYPPGNPSVRITRTLKVRESQGKKIAYANVIMYNTTVDDLLEVPAARLSALGLETTYFPHNGMSQLLITGNATAGAYQQALRYVKYTAPNSYMKTALQTRFWRNVTFQVCGVVNVLGVQSNTMQRAFRIDAAWKVLTESFPGRVDDTGRTTMGM